MSENWVSYKNGNYTVSINLEDGTKVRHNDKDCLVPDTIENFDYKITQCCDMMCPFCFESSSPDGKHGDIMHQKFIDSLHPYTEISCVSGDSIVYGEHGSIEVEELSVGDRIYDSDHKLRKIISIKTKEGVPLLLSLSGGKKIVCSPDHPLVTNGIVIDAKDTLGTKIDTLCECRDISDEIQYLDMSLYVHKEKQGLIGSRGGKVFEDNTVRITNSSKRIPRFIPVNEELMWLYGLFVAEGDKKGVTLGSWEFDNIEKSQSLWNHITGLSTKVTKDKNSRAVHVNFHSSGVLQAIFMEALEVKSGATNKNLSFLFKIHNKELIRQAIIGLIDGDGCYRSRLYTLKNGSEGCYSEISFKTSSKHLAFDLIYLLKKWFGVDASLTQGTNKTRYIDGRELPVTNYFAVEVYGKESIIKLLGEELFNRKFPSCNQGWTRKVNGTTVKKIEECRTKIKLYDITLEDGSHIFPINGTILTHNCGGGDCLSHPDLIPFLEKCKELKLIPSITVNQVHFEREQELIKKLVDEKLIYGLGISLAYVTDHFIKLVKEYPNAVIHVINGVVTEEQLNQLMFNDLKLLILGYKELGRGESLYHNAYSIIEERKQALRSVLSQMLNSGAFKVVSFDNRALRQLDVKSLISEEQWKAFYMGDDGIDGDYTSASMFVDGVKEEFALNSCSAERFKLKDDIKKMYKFLKKRYSVGGMKNE